MIIVFITGDGSRETPVFLFLFALALFTVKALVSERFFLNLTVFGFLPSKDPYKP